MRDFTISYKTLNYSVNGEIEATITCRNNLELVPTILEGLIKENSLIEFHLVVKEEAE